MLGTEYGIWIEEPDSASNPIAKCFGTCYEKNQSSIRSSRYEWISYLHLE
jgi:hypothetical protein